MKKITAIFLFLFLSSALFSAEVKITASDAEASDYFGQSVSISGDYAIAGANGEDAGGNNAGAAYSYLRSGVTWTETSKTTASDAAASDYFGFSVAISDDYAIVGAYSEDDGGTDAGAAYIYESIADLSLPVELVSFTANAGDGQITLKWTTESELENYAFFLERSEDNENFAQIAEIPGQGNCSHMTEYTYADINVKAGQIYYYRLCDSDYNGNITYHQTISITFKSMPTCFVLYQNYPNPFNPETTIRFDVPTVDGSLKDIKLNIYNSVGQLVIKLYEGQLSGGQYELKWNVVNQPSGIYFLNFQSGQFIQTQKIILMK